MKRSDQSLAIYGVLLLAVVGLVGYIVLIALGKEAPDVLLTGVVGVALGGVLGWARGGTYYEPDTEKVPSPPVIVEPLVEYKIGTPANFNAPLGPEKYPFAVDDTELGNRQ